MALIPADRVPMRSRGVADSLVKKEIGKGRMSEAEGADVKARVKGTSSMNDLANAQFIIEVRNELDSIWESFDDTVSNSTLR